ncbi:RDD family protein [Niveispirillum cyanobacteriorum]|uniref:Uncharacterized protein n=1 Tax=Niveispirillum cyanobacteriorum TaxID=1612173 RepID=A0A2K9NG50_9PROT|nr:RDD family protein [Niveispirillum cyanobacteriorum]AUN32094.1 hypothetical protein C0V82_16890 [Niveispirillum cyanobacteriorum]GGE74126.1 hypothetical protein GCM10011317_34080 [Niveispirillum cyanobacteriorum]
MESWWYAQDGKAYGPVKVSHLRYLLEMGDLNAGHWLWAPGMTGWAQAGSVAAFADQLRTVRASPHASYTGPSPAELPNTDGPRRAPPWSRFWAQALDYQLLLATFTLLLALAGYRVEHDGLRLLAAFMLLPVGLLLQAVLLSATGMTPGKWLLGLHLRHHDGTQPGLGSLIHRQKLLWKQGFAFGITPVSCFTMLNGKALLERARPVPWDEQTGMNVYQPRPGIDRQWLCVLLIAFLIVGSQALASHLLQKPVSLYF